MTSSTSYHAARRFGQKEGQIFTADLIIGLFIATVAFLALTLYTTGKAAPMRDDSERVSTLMTPGVPVDWNLTTVIIPGFLTNDRFDPVKINAFASLTLAQQHTLLGIRSNHRIRFYQGNTTLPLCSACGVDPVNASDILPIRRYGIWNGSIVTMEVLLYR